MSHSIGIADELSVLILVVAITYDGLCGYHRGRCPLCSPFRCIFFFIVTAIALDTICIWAGWRCCRRLCTCHCHICLRRRLCGRLSRYLIRHCRRFCHFILYHHYRYWYCSSCWPCHSRLLSWHYCVGRRYRHNWHCCQGYTAVVLVRDFLADADVLVVLRAASVISQFASIRSQRPFILLHGFLTAYLPTEVFGADFRVIADGVSAIYRVSSYILCRSWHFPFLLNVCSAPGVLTLIGSLQFIDLLRSPDIV